jgi:tetratricopeptide (TPR) repeat protein
MILGGGWWLERQQARGRAETARQEGRAVQAVEAAMEQAAGLRRQGRWPEVRAALNAVPTLLDASAPPGLRERLHQSRADADMVTALEEIRLRLSEASKPNEADSPRVERLYGEAFRDYGIDVATLEPAEAAARVRRSSIHDTLVAFLHDWLYWVSDENRKRLRDVVEQADHDPWRHDFREATAQRTVKWLTELATAPEAADQPPVILSGLGGFLLTEHQRDEAWSLLRDAQERHPGDFWINYLVGLFLEPERPGEAVGYLRVAVAVRPSSDQAYTLLAKALRDSGDAEGAIAAFEKAIELNPNHADVRDLAKMLAPRGQLERLRTRW